jgi:hypothetical protein
MQGKWVDRSGMIYGKLTVLSFNHKEHFESFWNCECECGRKVVVRGTSLVSGRTKSCGCLKKAINKSDRQVFIKKIDDEYQKRFAD